MTTEHQNPTTALDVRFDAFVARRDSKYEAHIIGGCPDYSFATDLSLRRRIHALPAVYPFFRALTNTYAPRARQQINMTGLRVGPEQYPEIHAMAIDCADTLGIGIPTMYIVPDNTVNAYTIATDDAAPIIVLHSGLVERLQPSELKAIIGHECGHIHNNHGVFQIALDLILGTGLNIPVVNQILALLSLPLRLLLLNWQRAGEVTSDRAGMICADDPMDAIHAMAKLTQGALLNQQGVNVDALLKQYEMLRQTPVRFLELTTTHPTTVRRVLAMLEFENSQTLYSWRPSPRPSSQRLLTKEELDANCAKYTNVTKGKEA